MYYPKLEHPDCCKHCLSCVKTCPTSAIEYQGESFQVNIVKCLDKGECMLCIQVCPTGAIVPRKSSKAKKEK